MFKAILATVLVGLGLLFGVSQASADYDGDAAKARAIEECRIDNPYTMVRYADGFLWYLHWFGSTEDAQIANLVAQGHDARPGNDWVPVYVAYEKLARPFIYFYTPQPVPYVDSLTDYYDQHDIPWYIRC